jgi:hypothetical protein
VATPRPPPSRGSQHVNTSSPHRPPRPDRHATAASRNLTEGRETGRDLRLGCSRSCVWPANGLYIHRLAHRVGLPLLVCSVPLGTQWVDFSRAATTGLPS